MRGYSSIGLAAALLAAGMAGAQISIAPSRRRGGRDDVVVLGDDPLSIVDFTPPAKPSAPAPTTMTQDDLDRIRQAQRRRRAKAERQAKGFR